MSNTSRTRLANLDPKRVALLAAIAKASERHVAPYVVIGAFARDIWLEHCHGLPPSRRTFDLDAAIHVETWEHYTSFRKCLIRDFGFSDSDDPNQPQRLISAEGIPLDLLPFGGIDRSSDDGAVIAWPSDDVVMSVSGFDAALESAVHFEFLHNSRLVDLPVLMIPALATLKLIAWRDSGTSGPQKRKHMADIHAIIENYPTLNPKAADVFDLPQGVSDPNRLNAYFLGRELQLFGDGVLVTELASLLESQATPGGRSQMAHDLKAHTYGNFHDARDLIKWLHKGIVHPH